MLVLQPTSFPFNRLPLKLLLQLQPQHPLQLSLLLRFQSPLQLQLFMLSILKIIFCVSTQTYTPLYIPTTTYTPTTVAPISYNTDSAPTSTPSPTSTPAPTSISIFNFKNHFIPYCFGFCFYCVFSSILFYLFPNSNSTHNYIFPHNRDSSSNSNFYPNCFPGSRSYLISSNYWLQYNRTLYFQF
jgi:hypothetical protein